MSRARNIKPGVMENERLAECSPYARLLFVYMWMIADRAGRMEDRPKRIKALTLPYDNVDAEPLLQELHEAKFINRYEVDGERYIQIVNFEKHQTPHVKEKASTIPTCATNQATTVQEPDLHHTSTVQAPDLHQTSTVQVPENTDTSTGVAPPDSLIPDSLIPDTEKTLCASDHLDFENFERFWEAGMRKVEKKTSFAAFRRLLKGMSQPARHEFTCKLVADVQKRIALNQFGFDSLHPTTYLNGERWNDEYPRPESRASPGKSNIYDLTNQNYVSGDL